MALFMRYLFRPLNSRGSLVYDVRFQSRVRLIPCLCQDANHGTLYLHQSIWFWTTKKKKKKNWCKLSSPGGAATARWHAAGHPFESDRECTLSNPRLGEDPPRIEVPILLGEPIIPNRSRRPMKW